MNIIQAIDDPHIFRGVVRDHATWTAWRGFLKALFALPMDDGEAALFRQCTGRVTPPEIAFQAAELCIGRRGGKSFALALIAVFKAVFVDYQPFLSKGERATVVIIAADRKQARTIFRYIKGIMEDVPTLRALIAGETAEEMRLTIPVNIEVMTASSRTVRGYAIPVALLDEAAFWTVEGSSDADVEIMASLKPAMQQFPDRMLLMASSPYGRRGAFWETFRDHHGVDRSRVLVWQAATRVMNPTIPQADIDAAYEEDPARAAAEYGAQFRTDIESFVSREAVMDALVPKRRELPYVAGTTYVGFVDPSGSGADAMTMAIAHREKDGAAVLDAVRWRTPPFSPEKVVAEFVDVLKSYHVSRVVGDHWGGEFVKEPFRKLGIDYKLSDKVRSDIYLSLLPLLNSGKVQLLDIPRLTTELCALERRTARSGKDTVNHPPKGHDDVVNSAAGALVLAGAGHGPMVVNGDAVARFAQATRGSTPSAQFGRLGSVRRRSTLLDRPRDI